MKPLISIIIPIYKVELYLQQCIDSVLRQTYENLEIILVDDGSPDNCPQICDEYAEKDRRIRVIHKENGGLSDARNAGIEVAKGEFIGFIDSDDYIVPDMYEYLYKGIVEYDADVAVCGYFECFENKIIAPYNPEIRIFEEDEVMDALLRLKVGNYAWNKLYRRELWEDGIRYPKGKLYEDVRTTYRVFEKVKKVVALPNPKYYYRRTGESITTNNSINNKVQSVLARVEKFLILTERYPKPRLFMLKDIFRFLPELREAIVRNNKKEFQAYSNELKEISEFFKIYEAETSAACEFGRLSKIAYRFMTKGNRYGWICSYYIEKIVGLKKSIYNFDFVKKVRKNIWRWKESERKRLYYKVYSKLPIRQTAIIESRAGEDLAGNMFEIAQELCSRGIKVYLSVKPSSLEKVEEILKTGRFLNLEIVKKYSKSYYKAFATSKYWFNDMVFEDLTKREGQIYVNTWHGTPLKNLEFDVKEQRHNLGGASRDFLKCDYLSVPSKFLFEKLLESACVETVYRGKALYSGYPRNSVFFDETKRINVRNALKFEDKEIFVYMPTWRGNLLQHSRTEGDYSVENIMNFFERNLKENQIMLVKLHNYASASIQFECYKKVLPFPKGFDAYAVLNIADCLITDYSSVFFDFVNTGKKIVLFTYDREEYLRDRGLYLDLNDLPFPKADTYEELLMHLNSEKDYDDSLFIKRFCEYDCINSTQKLIDHIVDEKNTCSTESVVSNGKKNVLLYDSEVERRLSDSSEIEKILEELETEKYNYFYCYPQCLLKSTPEYIYNMRKEIQIFTFNRYLHSIWTEKLLMKILRKKVLLSQAKRELNRQINGQVFDEIRILGNNEYDPFVYIIDRINNLK